MMGKIIILSAPSRCGKDVTLSALMEDRSLNFKSIVTYTTRPKREYECNGVHHYFISPTQFRAMIKQGVFLEWAKVRKAYFGTPLKPVIEILERNKNVLLKIDVQGAQIVKKKLGDAVASIFIRPSSLNDIKERMIAAEFSAEQQRIRLAEARKEIASSSSYDYVVENVPGKLAEMINQIKSIIRSILRPKKAKRQNT